MHKQHFGPIIWASMILILVSLACAALVPSAVAPAATLAPEATGAPVATAAVLPTSTLPPEAVPTVDTPTMQVTGERLDQIQTYQDKGYIDTVAGKFTDLQDFKEQWAQLGWYQWWPLDGNYSTFVYGGHFKWSAASSTSELGGCGIVFGLQDTKDHYVVFLDRSRIAFELSRGGNNYEVGKTRGSGRVSFSNPAEADFGLIVNGQKAYVSVDGQVTEYTLSADQTSTGQIALTLLSGTNRDYGTRCEMTNAFLWEPTQ